MCVASNLSLTDTTGNDLAIRQAGPGDLLTVTRCVVKQSGEPAWACIGINTAICCLTTGSLVAFSRDERLYVARFVQSRTCDLLQLLRRPEAIFDQKPITDFWDQIPLERIEGRQLLVIATMSDRGHLQNQSATLRPALIDAIRTKRINPLFLGIRTARLSNSAMLQSHAS
jgi:hypothetical protein